MVHRSYPFLFGAVTLLTLLTHSLLGAPPNKRPTVSITSPANGATFTAPANITVSANATDSDGTVSKVDFYAGATLIGTDTTAPYSIVWSNVAAGSYSLTAKATDNENATRTSSVVTITVSAATPPAPTGLAASAASSSQINLSWTDNSTNETGFRVERKLGAGGTYAEVASVGANVTTYNDTGLSAGTQYYYRVRAYNGSGNSAYSNEANATTVGTAPAAPTGLTATAGNAQVSSSWTASSGATSYKVFRATSPGSYNYGSPLASGVTTTTYIDTTAVNGTTYYYVVRATNTAGDSSSSNEVNATPNNNNTAPTVSITSPTNNATFTAPATINIEATASDADGTVSKVEFFQGTTKLGEDTTTPYSYVWNNVAAGSYSLTAKATDNAGATTTSSAVNITVNSSGGGSAATYVRTDTTTQGSWKGLYGADGYNIINDAVSYPTYAQITPSGQPSWTWAASTGDMRALQKAATSDRIAATWYSDTGFTIDLNLTDGQTHQIALYCLDWDNGGRAQTLEILDAANNAVLDSRSISAFTQGQYLVWNLSGQVRIRVTRTAGYNAVVSGLFFNPVAPPVSPNLYGQWSAPFSWPDVAIHLHVMPNGNVLTWADDDDAHYHNDGSRRPDKTKAYVWDIGTSTNPQFQPINNESTNLFCSGHAFLPDGRLLIMGGHEGRDGFGSTDTNFFDYRVQSYGSWSRASSMASGRWYPSAVSLANGEVLTVSGSDDGTTVPDIPEVYQTDGRWRSLTGARFALPLYPFLHLAPNGKVLLAGPDQGTYFLDTSGTGLWTFLANRTFGSRDYGTSVMYDNGKVLVIGGGNPPTNTAEVIDLNAASPTWQSTGSMAYARRQLNATLLPDGKVLATGGTSGGGFNNATGTVFAAEMWDPATGTWSTMAGMQVPRLYHSTAVLLPDGRVLSAGGGRPSATGEDPYTEHRDAEIYSPPYLFKGARPTITSAPTTRLGYNQTFLVGTAEATSITKVTLIRLSSSTHAFNMNQLINNLNFSQGGGGLNVTTPLNSNLCPPGHYMLFILNGNGVPSVAKIIQIG